MDKFTIPPGYTGRCTPGELRRRAARLEVNELFLDEFKAATKRFVQRNVINQYVTGQVKAADREQLRRYFCDYLRIETPLGVGDQFAEDATLLFTEDPPRWADTPPAKKVVINKPPSLKELIETKLGPCEPDPMQELRDIVLSEITTAFGDSHARKLAKSHALVGGLMTSAAANTVSKPFNLADVELFSAYMDEAAAIPTREWFLLDTPLIRGEFGRLDGVRFLNASPSHQSIKKETPVNTKPLTITTKTFTYVNGVDVNNYSANELYDMIAREESKIRALEAIDNKPVMLQQEIARRKDGIAALVAHLDAVTVVPTPAPVVTDTDASNALATGQ